MPSCDWHLDCILITCPIRWSRRLRIVRFKRGQLGPMSEFCCGHSCRPGNAKRSPDHSTMARVDLPNNDGVMGTDSCPYIAIVSIVDLKRRTLIVSLT